MSSHAQTMHSEPLLTKTYHCHEVLDVIETFYFIWFLFLFKYSVYVTITDMLLTFANILVLLCIDF